MTTFRPGDRVHLKGHAHTPATTGTVIIETLTTAHVRWDDNDATTPHHPQHLEPAGEPMSTTFHSTAGHNPEDHLRIDGSAGHLEFEAVLWTGAHLDPGRGIKVPSNSAPAICLAILEAAGWPGDYPGGVSNQIVADLRRVVEITEQNAKEAADAEALEHEAEALYLAACESLAATAAGHTTVAWDDLSGRTQEAHLSAARKARQLHGVTK